MKQHLEEKKLAVALVLTLGLLSQAEAARFNFTQNGFTGGGTITGYFDAVDLNNNGQISSFGGEVTGFSVSFLGDSIVGDFSQNLTDLSGLVYDLGTPFLGDGPTGATEGLATRWFPAPSGYSFTSGLGPTGSYGGQVRNLSTGLVSTTPNLIRVSAVPEPSSMLVFLTGLVAIFGHSRFRFVKIV